MTIQEIVELFIMAFLIVSGTEMFVSFIDKFKG